MASPESGQATISFDIGAGAKIGVIADAVRDVRVVCDLVDSVHWMVQRNLANLRFAGFDELGNYTALPVSDEEFEWLEHFWWWRSTGSLRRDVEYPPREDPQQGIPVVRLTYNNPIEITLGIEKVLDSFRAILEVVRDWGLARDRARAETRSIQIQNDREEQANAEYVSAARMRAEVPQFAVDQITKHELPLTSAQIRSLLPPETVQAVEALGLSDVTIQYPGASRRG